MRRICVFTGSNLGKRPEYKEAARALGQEMAARGIGLVYGGASVGLMGVIADTVLAGGGEAIGIIPRGLFRREVGHQGLTKLYEVESMHERKALMADLADGFIALPGGYGTFDELFEIITWEQLGLHTKPIGLLNVAGYFTPLLALITHASKEGFILPVHTGIVIHEQSPIALLDRLTNHRPDITKNIWLELPSEPQAT
ncbi:MAG TPA: TIGR00730 family Rossman fold protein [Ktedonobacteraceae bacterium]|nr:TIGR00730 family Rossman fold protein [Ktedonobacteraceae bacterium]